MLIGIARILGQANRYLAAGGVKGDSHFPWHSMSTLSKVRQALDMWASDTQEAFTSIEALFGRPDSVIFVMSKLIYHLIYCLIYSARNMTREQAVLRRELKYVQTQDTTKSKQVMPFKRVRV